jgi:hypothetical protein
VARRSRGRRRRRTARLDGRIHRCVSQRRRRRGSPHRTESALDDAERRPVRAACMCRTSRINSNIARYFLCVLPQPRGSRCDSCCFTRSCLGIASAVLETARRGRALSRRTVGQWGSEPAPAAKPHRAKEAGIAVRRARHERTRQPRLRGLRADQEAKAPRQPYSRRPGATAAAAVAAEAR